MMMLTSDANIFLDFVNGTRYSLKKEIAPPEITANGILQGIIVYMLLELLGVAIVTSP